MGLVRVIHPFPTALDSLVTAALAALAGGSADVIVRLAVAMFAIQASIGATNDIVDASRDAQVKPSKPIPARDVPVSTARVLAFGALAVGLVLAASVSAAACALAVAGSAAGYAYDLRLKGTAASWVPFAVGIPVLPLFAWTGATGGVPSAVLVLAGLAVPAGAAIAIANALPDLERDRSSGIASVATALGPRRGWLVDGMLVVIVVAGAVASFAALGGFAWLASDLPHQPAQPSEIGLLAAALGLLSLTSLAVGVRLSRSVPRSGRQRGWELQAIGVGLLAAGWIAGLVAANRL